jgi:hypothetical protein
MLCLALILREVQRALDIRIAGARYFIPHAACATSTAPRDPSHNIDAGRLGSNVQRGDTIRVTMSLSKKQGLRRATSPRCASSRDQVEGARAQKR